jgi:TolB-like protein/DNA-binding winged helix-turn-helix (wHTH) protein/tetratricopeptide (TPR) repeat protein
MNETRTSYLFGDWLVVPHLNRVSKDGVMHQLEPLTMDVLAYLLVNPGQVVTTDEILDQVWSGRPAQPGMVVKRVNQIRTALNDNPKLPTHIETIAKRGYRAIAPIVPALGTTGSGTGAPQSARMRYGVLVVVVALGILAWIGLDFFGPSTETPIRSIAVLPLENISGDPNQEYVADGMTEELITELGKFRELRVISRTSILRYKKTELSLPEIAMELGVAGIIEGTVARETDHFRVTIQFIDARTDTHLWADSFDRKTSSVLALRRDVAREVADQLRLNLVGGENGQVALPRAIDPAAYDAYLRGLASRGPSETFGDWGPQALADFERAVSIEPDFADAWAQLALIRFIQALRNNEFVTEARSAANRAISIDDRLGQAHAVLGLIRVVNDWDPGGARAEFERAIQLSPNDPTAMVGYQVYLRVDRKFAEALQQSERRRQVSPRDVAWLATVVEDYYELRRYERTLAEADAMRYVDPAAAVLAESAAYHKLGRFEESFHTLVTYFRWCGAFCDSKRRALEDGWAKGNYEGAIRAWLRHELASESPDAITISQLYARVGDVDEAFVWLEHSFEARIPFLITLWTNPIFDVLRPDPRTNSILERMKLPTHNVAPSELADLGRELAFRGQTIEAIQQLERAIDMSPDDLRLSRWLDSLSWAHFAAADYEQAARLARRVLQSDVSAHAAAFANLMLASSYAHLDRPDDSSAALRKGIELWPTQLEVDRDLLPLFLGANDELQDRYIEGLNSAGI